MCLFITLTSENVLPQIKHLGIVVFLVLLFGLFSNFRNDVCHDVEATDEDCQSFLESIIEKV